MSDFNRQVLVGVVISSDWQTYGFEKGEIVEVGYHDESGNLLDENSEGAHLWCQTWGIWNPVMGDFMNADDVTILGEHLDWRSPKYNQLSGNLIKEAAEIRKRNERDDGR